MEQTLSCPKWPPSRGIDSLQLLQHYACKPSSAGFLTESDSSIGPTSGIAPPRLSVAILSQFATLSLTDHAHPTTPHNNTIIMEHINGTESVSPPKPVLRSYAAATQAIHADDHLSGSADVSPAMHVSTTFRYSNDPVVLRPVSDDDVSDLT